MDESQLVDDLEGFEFTEYQSRAYVAAVTLGTASPNELATASEVPQGRIYDVIDDLEEQGLLEVRERSRTKEVRAPPPGVVLEQFKQRRLESFGEQVDSVAVSLEQLHEYDQSSGGFVTMVRHRESALRHIRRAVEDAEVWLTLALPVDLYEDVAGEIAAAEDRGVTVRLMIDGEAARNAGQRPDRLGPSFPDGIAVRHRPSIDTFTFADRSYGIFNSNHPRGRSRPYIVSQEQNLVLVFQNYAEQIWTGSETLQSDTGLPRRYLDPWRAIVDMGERLATDRLHATVEGHEIETWRADSWAGEIVDFDIGSPVAADFESTIPTTASLTIDTGHDVVTVGGWKATVEDIAAQRIDIRE
jgi:sugar-specific transcriptional regulator TrmB